MADQKKNRKKVLIASCILAALIVGSSSFAWFTSQDEVTNRLAASNNYGVTITESFTPPTQWLPGQEINKDVSAVNTGNVDAFVRMAISNKLNLTSYTTGQALPTVGSAPIANTGTSLVVLNKEFTDAVDETSNNNAVGARADEVTTIQAGGKLVIAAGDTVSPSDAQNIESAKYKPSKTGLYIFQREIKYSSADNQYTYTYAGYYYVADTADTEINGGKGTYYAIDIASDALTKNDDETVTVDTSKITLKATKNQVLEDNNEDNKITLDYTNLSNNVVTAQYIGADNRKDTDDDIIININLATSLDDNGKYVESGAKKWSDFWDYDSITNKFYLKSILPAGKESAKLIDSVTLDSKVQKQAYIDFNYDLTVTLDSIQVAYDETKSDGYKPTAVNAEWKTGGTGYPKATVSGSTVTWEFQTP